jgi:hypothetical protein
VIFVYVVNYLNCAPAHTSFSLCYMCGFTMCGGHGILVYFTIIVMKTILCVCMWEMRRKSKHFCTSTIKRD